MQVGGAVLRGSGWYVSSKFDAPLVAMALCLKSPFDALVRNRRRREFVVGSVRWKKS